MLVVLAITNRDARRALFQARDEKLFPQKLIQFAVFAATLFAS
jgi:hypothetical protein